MLTGISRSGKSTLINILSEKLISLETPEFLSVTTEINEYIIYKEIKKDTIIKLKFIESFFHRKNCINWYTRINSRKRQWYNRQGN